MADKTKPADAPTEHAEFIPPASSYEICLHAAADLGAQAAGAQIELVTLEAPANWIGVPSKIPVATLRGERPEVHSVADLFERYRLHPVRKAGTAKAQTFDAFCELVNRHKTPDTALFADADWQKPSFTAVIDYHELAERGRADFGKHRVHYAFPLSEEWKAWTKMNGEKMTQEDFAYFLEDHIAELTSPTDAERVWIERDFSVTVATPNQLVELSRGLQVNISSKVKQHHTLASGEGQIVWEETHQGADGKPLKVPGMFMLNIAPFFMGQTMRIPVRLRYRPSGGSITWLYQIFRPDQFVTEHVRNTLADARTRTNLPAYEGAPEMQA